MFNKILRGEGEGARSAAYNEEDDRMKLSMTKLYQPNKHYIFEPIYNLILPITKLTSTKPFSVTELISHSSFFIAKKRV